MSVHDSLTKPVPYAARPSIIFHANTCVLHTHMYVYTLIDLSLSLFSLPERPPQTLRPGSSKGLFLSVERESELGRMPQPKKGGLVVQVFCFAVEREKVCPKGGERESSKK